MFSCKKKVVVDRTTVYPKIPQERKPKYFLKNVRYPNFIEAPNKYKYINQTRLEYPVPLNPKYGRITQNTAPKIKYIRIILSEELFKILFNSGENAYKIKYVVINQYEL